MVIKELDFQAPRRLVLSKNAAELNRELGRATPSLRPSIDLLYDIEQIINPSRLTKALDQFG
jgi:hypothetical protein